MNNWNEITFPIWNFETQIMAIWKVMSQISKMIHDI
jgi:hypothetical protein